MALHASWFYFIDEFPAARALTPPGSGIKVELCQSLISRRGWIGRRPISLLWKYPKLYKYSSTLVVKDASMLIGKHN